MLKARFETFNTKTISSHPVSHFVLACNNYIFISYYHHCLVGEVEMKNGRLSSKTMSRSRVGMSWEND